MGTPIARVTDKVAHPLPGILQPGPGSTNVIVGYLPAWRGVPALAAAALSAAKAISDTTVNAAKTASTAAMGTPAAPAAKAAEEAVKAAALSAMTAMMNSAKAASTSMSGGSPDIHICGTFPPTPAHGPGMVLDGNPTVLINGLPACQVGDKVTEALGPPDPIIMGKANVIIGENGGGGGGGGGLGAALASLLGAAAGVAAAAISIAAGVVEFVTEVGKAVVAAAQQLARNVLNAVKKGVSVFVAAVKKAVTQTKEQKAMSLIKTAGTADQKDAELVAKELAKMSEADLDLMKKNGTTVVVVRNSVTEQRTDLRGVQPRGWPAGKTWDSVPGLYDSNKNEVIIATTGHGTPAGAHVPATGEGHGSSNLVVHEAGHAVDLGGGPPHLNSDPDFQAARTKDIANLPAYETQAGNAGLEESFAEAMARSAEGQSSNQPNLDAYFKGRK